MTVASSLAKAGPYDADGGVKEFPFQFRALDPSHIKVVTEGGVTSAYTVRLQGDGGVVTFEQPPADGVTLTVLRDVPITQTTDIQNNTAFFPEIWESGIDKLTMICQQMQEEIDRCAKVSATSGVDATEYIENLVTVTVNSKDVALNAAVAAANSAQTAAISERNISLIWAEITGDTTLAENALLTVKEAAEATGAITTAKEIAVGEINNIGATAIAATNKAAAEAKEAADRASNTAGAIQGTVADEITIQISQAVGAEGALGAAILGGIQDVENARQQALDKANATLSQFKEGTAEFENAKNQGLSQIDQKISGVSLDVETVLARAQIIADGYLDNAQATVSGSISDLEKMKADALAAGDKALADLAAKRIAELQNLQKLLDDADSAASAAEQFRDAAQSSAGDALSQAQGAAGSASSALGAAQESATSAADALKSAQDAAISASNAHASELAASQTATNISNELVSTHNYSNSAHKNLFDSKLSRSGGTMTGTISVSAGVFAEKTTDDSYLEISGGTGERGAFLRLWGVDSSESGGSVALVAVAKNGEKKRLFLRPDGSFDLEGQNIVRSIDGVNADAAGNVDLNALNALPKSGGTMTGNIYSAASGESLLICGGEDVNSGACLRLDSKDHSSTPGVFRVVANNGTTSKTLAGLPDGSMRWDGKDITLGYPNYAAGTTTTANTYTASADGWVAVSQNLHDSYFVVKINNVFVGGGGGSDYDTSSFFFPVKKGDIVKTYSSSDGMIAGAAINTNVAFYPNR